jgi:N-acetyl-gamma-glutamylphosphate reductase
MNMNTIESSNPGSFNTFKEGLEAEITAQQALQLYTSALHRHRKEIALHSGVSIDELHSAPLASSAIHHEAKEIAQ